MQATAHTPPETPRPYRTFSPATNVSARSVAATGDADPEAAPAVPARALPPARPEPLPSRFAPPPVRAMADDPPDGPVPGYEAPEVAEQDAVSAFAPHESPDDGDVLDPRGVDALDDAPSPQSGSEEDGADGESVGELEEEMARLLNQISTSQRE